MLTVRDFIYKVYKLISAGTPTQTLHGSDQCLAISVLNDLLQSYASSGQLLTIAKTVSVPVTAGQENVTVGPSGYMPTPDITNGRLANLDNAWLILDNVTYPLKNESRNVYLSSYKFEPLMGLPLYIITFPDTDIVTLRLYPAPEQQYELFIRGKFQLSELDSNDDMSSLPAYFRRFLYFATAKDVAMYKGRAEAWTQKLEDMYREAKDEMINASEINVAITDTNPSMLNGANRVKAGV